MDTDNDQKIPFEYRMQAFQKATLQWIEAAEKMGILVTVAGNKDSHLLALDKTAYEKDGVCKGSSIFLKRYPVLDNDPLLKKYEDNPLFH